MSEPAGERTHAFEFRGSAGEYFRIWIVNLLLTVATLGVYSAWAKVRSARYFAGSTRLDGAAFAYLAEPLAILKGRLLVLGFAVLYFVASLVSPILEGAFAIGVIFLIPWAIVRSMAFRAHHTAWRGVRFRFDAPYGEALTTYMGLPILAALTLGLVYPYCVYRQRGFLVSRAAFGTTPFVFGSSSGDFYRLFGGVLLVAIGAAVAIGAVFAAGGETGLAPALSVAGAAGIPVYFYLFGRVASGITNLTYQGARLGPHRLASSLPATRLAVLYFTNALAILASLGLLVPWAHVRLARFRLSHLSLHATGPLDDFAAAEAEQVQSLGAELGDALDLDLGL
jgi:uncharacterized membrane protein YjgN (DUF898 family)